MKIFHGFALNNLRGDFFGGLTAAVVALPLALAFGVSSGLGPLAGLYGAIIVGFLRLFLAEQNSNFWTNWTNDSCYCFYFFTF